MPVAWNIESDDLIVCRVSGQLGEAEHDQIQTEVGTVQNSNEKKCVLVIFENFTGWEKTEGWEDTSFIDRNDEKIKKMAIVGEDKWRALISAFTLQGLRPVPIEYFTEEDAARKWLDSDA